MMKPIDLSVLLAAPDAEIQEFAALLRAQLDGEGCTCDPSVLIKGPGDLGVGHDDTCRLCNSGKSIFRTSELRKEPS